MAPSSLPWYVEAIAYPSDPSNAQPLYVQGRSKPGIALAGPFTTKAQAIAWAHTTGASNFGKGKTNIAAPTDLPVTAGLGSIGNPLTGINAVGDFFQRLTQGNTWVRIGEVTAGVILLGVGINHFTGGAATKTAMAAAKVIK